ncbi:ABC transporter substrate-binding protein [uncultured Cocleimonas sp.]|uniref:ABC transporter substrate-binding protein n=1 Tax=uncultured Cocleimonas sp. TaxID=1051587 RepID=UPI002636CA23|nr:ABC transporter substrate-binding protein [uncultured Cocleimonas sp.]
MKKQLGFIGKVSGLLLTSLLVLNPATAKTLKLAYDADPVSLDIHEQLSGGMLQLSHMTHDPLVRWAQDLSFEPRLATSWERTDENTVRFKLREGVKFHSGNTLTAADFKWTFDRLKTSKDFKGIFSNFKALNVIDDNTIDLVTDGPYPLVMHTATYIFPMDSKFYAGKDANGKDKAEIVKDGASFASSNTSGTGPFKVTSREQGVKVVFDRFADYWDKDSKGNVSQVILTPIKDNQTRVAALLSGDVDFIAPVAPNEFGQIEANDKVQLVTMAGTRVITFQLNQERRKEFKDQKVRQAMTYAVNNEGIVQKIMKGFATTAGQMSPKGYLGYNESLKPRFNLEKAKQLMSESGYPDGFSVTMMAPNNRYVNDEKIAQAVAAMLSKINIKVDLKTMPKAQYWPEFDKRAADMMMIGWHSDTEDSANFYEFLAMTPNKETGMGAYNSGNYSSKMVDETTMKANKETDDTKRAAMLKSIEKQIYDDAAFIPLHWQNLAWASRKGVNIKPIVNAMNFPYIGDLAID